MPNNVVSKNLSFQIVGHRHETSQNNKTIVLDEKMTIQFQFKKSRKKAGAESFFG